MRRILFSMGVIVGLSALVAQSVQSQSQPSKQASPAGQSARSAADRSADEAAIRANIAQFVKAYNAGDAKAVAALFTPDGQAVDKDGNDAEGREAIATDLRGAVRGNAEETTSRYRSSRFSSSGRTWRWRSGRRKKRPRRASRRSTTATRCCTSNATASGKWRWHATKKARPPQPTSSYGRLPGWSANGWTTTAAPSSFRPAAGARTGIFSCRTSSSSSTAATPWTSRSGSAGTRLPNKSTPGCLIPRVVMGKAFGLVTETTGSLKPRGSARTGRRPRQRTC